MPVVLLVEAGRRDGRDVLSLGVECGEGRGGGSEALERGSGWEVRVVDG